MQPDPGRSWRGVLAFLAGALALVLLDCGLRCALEPPAQLGVDAPANAFSAARARATWTRVSASGGAHPPHPMGSAAAAELRAQIVAELAAQGLEARVEESVIQRGATLARVRNVVVPPAHSSPHGAVLVCAHYDSVAAGPGAGDDGAGVAVLLELARALHAETAGAEHPVMFLIDDGEELGLLGAQAFVDGSALKGEVGIVVNLEARGTCGPSRMFETSPGNAGLIALLARSLPHPSANSLSYEIYRRMPNDTDLTVFKRAGLAGLNFAFVGGGRRYHSSRDDLEHLDARTLQHHGENALAIVRALSAHAGDFAAAAGDAVFTDVLGHWFLLWPAGWSAPIALLPLLLVLALAWRARRRELGSLRELARGLGLLALGIVGAVAAAWLLDLAVSAHNGGVRPWPPGSGWARVAVTSASAAAVALAAALTLNARVRPLAVLLAFALAQALAGFALALALPGACFLFVLPAALSALGLAFLPHRPLALACAALVLAAGQALLLVPLLQGIEEVVELRTLDTRAVLLFGAAWAGLLVPIAAALAAPARKRQLVLAGAFALLGVLALIAVLRQPARTADEPEPLFLAQVEREGEPGATLYLRAAEGVLPAGWTAASRFTAARENPFPWWRRSFASQVARVEASAGLGHASWKVLERGQEGERRTLRLELASPARARHLVLELPAGVELLGARFHGHATPAKLRGAVGLDLVGFEDEPIELLLAVARTDEVEAELLEVRSAEGGPLRELIDTRPGELAAIGEGDLSIGACKLRL